MSVTHASFTIERDYPQPPEKVFGAYASPASKRRWLVEGEGFTVESYEPGFGVGARERSSFRYQGGPIVTNDTVYTDIVERRRIVFTYWMTLEGRPMSTSLVTVLIEPEGNGTRMTFTEQGAYNEGFADVAGREQGTRGLLDALERDLSANG